MIDHHVRGVRAEWQHEEPMSDYYVIVEDNNAKIKDFVHQI